MCMHACIKSGVGAWVRACLYAGMHLSRACVHRACGCASFDGCASVFMYARACVLAHVSHTCVQRICMCACMRPCVHACMRACGHACMRSCVHPCMHVCVHACILHTFVCTRVACMGACKMHKWVSEQAKNQWASQGISLWVRHDPFSEWVCEWADV